MRDSPGGVHAEGQDHRCSAKSCPLEQIAGKVGSGACRRADALPHASACAWYWELEWQLKSSRTFAGGGIDGGGADSAEREGELRWVGRTGGEAVTGCGLCQSVGERELCVRRHQSLRIYGC